MFRVAPPGSASSVRSSGNRRDVTHRWKTYFTDIYVPKSIFVDSEAEKRWANRNLDPIPPERCNWREWDYVAYWCNEVFTLAMWANISTVMLSGFTAKEAIPICMIGFILCGCVITMTTLVGCQYRVPYPVATRIAFGLWGSLPAVAARCFVALMWLSIVTYIGGRLTQVLLSAIFPSFLHMHNPFPASANITASELLSLFIYWGAQTLCSFMSIDKIRLIIVIKAVTIIPTFLILLVWAITVTKGDGPLINGPTVITYPYGIVWAWISGISHVAGLISSLSVNMPDFGRYSRDERGGISQIYAFPLFGTFAAVTAIFVTAAGQELWGEVIWDFPTLLSKFDSRPAKFFCSAVFLLATLGSELGGDCIPFANDSMALAPRYINRFRANTFATVVCVLMTPWNIIKSGQGFLTFLLGYSSYTSCLAAIMIADFFLVKRQKIDVRELYKPHGLYWYTHGWNWRAYVAFCVGFLPSVPGFAKSIDKSLQIGSAWAPFQMAWIFGTVVSTVTYLLVNLIWPDPAKISEAVKPHEVFAERRRARAAEKARRKQLLLQEEVLQQQQMQQQQGGVQEGSTFGSVDLDAGTFSKDSNEAVPARDSDRSAPRSLAALSADDKLINDVEARTDSYFVSSLPRHNASQDENCDTKNEDVIELREKERHGTRDAFRTDLA